MKNVNKAVDSKPVVSSEVSKPVSKAITETKGVIKGQAEKKPEQAEKKPEQAKKSIVPVPEKDLHKRNLISFLNKFHIETVWNKKHEQRFIDVLDGGYISSQNTELSSLGLFLKRKNITLVKPDGKAFDFTECFKWSDIMQDADKVKKEKISFGNAKIRFHKSFLADYGLVFASIARGVKDYNSVDGVKGDEGKQILSFISLLVTSGYKFK